jgi:Zn-dependent peptidase ImmA (M78 family)
MVTMTFDEISELAERYARKYNPGSIAPFPHENIVAAHPDLEIYFTDLEDDKVAGVTLFGKGKYTILINITKPEVRQHFALGHELGHYFLHKDFLRAEKGIVDSESWPGDPTLQYQAEDSTILRMDQEANRFAASLLMPEDLLGRAWRAFDSIVECARIFKVPVVAVSVRITELGLIEE